MSALTDTRLFNRTDRVVEGWTWALRSSDLPIGGVRQLRLLGRDLVAWRGADGVARVWDAHCPHMGAHLGLGKVDGDRLRCFFHDWHFDTHGRVVHIPCQDHVVPAQVRTWPVSEQYGLIWVYPGATPRYDVPVIPELKGRPMRHALGNTFRKGCHPNVMMVNAIDEQHFASVHQLPVDLSFEVRTEPDADNAAVTWDNTTRLPQDRWLLRALGRFYQGPLTYRMTYWAGSNGSVTVGPDFWHFHILFALRPDGEGGSEGQTILVTEAAPGLAGRAWNAFALRASQVVGDYFAVGDTMVFETIRFSLAHPVKADRSIVAFIRHVEEQPAIAWGTWDRVDAAPQAAAG